MMKTRKRLRHQSILFYMMVISILIFLIIAVMGGYLYQFYYKTIYQNFLTANRADVIAIQKRHETDIDIMDDIVAQINLSTDCTEFMLDDQPLKSQKLEEQLYRYTAVSQFFDQVWYYYHPDCYLYNHKTSTELDYFVNTGFVLEKTTPDTLKELLKEEGIKTKILPEQYAVGYVPKNYMANQGKITVYIRTILPKKTASLMFLVGESYYNRILAGNNQTYTHYLLYDNEMIVERDCYDISSEAFLEAWRQQEHTIISDDSVLQYTELLEGEEYLITEQTGESGIVYVTMQPMSIFWKQMRNGQWGVLFVLLSSCIMAAAGILIFSRYIVGRVKKINTVLLKSDKAYDLSSMESGIELLVKNNERLAENREQAVKAQIPFKKARFIGNFVRAVYKSDASIISAARDAKLCADQRYFLIVMTGNRNETNTDTEEELEARMLELLEQSKVVDGYGIRLISKKRNLFVLFGNAIEEMELLLACMLSEGQKHGSEFVLSVSDYHTNRMEAAQAFLEADTAFDTRFLVDTSMMIRYQAVTQIDHIEVLPESFMRRLKNAIRGGNKEEAKQVIQEICEKLKREEHSLLSFRVLYSDILHMLVTEWNDTHVDFSNIYNVFLLSQCFNLEEFSSVLGEVCEKLIDAKRSGSEETPDRAARAVLYMKENYQNAELTMAAMAEELEVSPVTLSVEFKNKMGVSPSDYLASLRMEKAKELLRNTDKKVKEISMLVGYEDDHVFMRRFKKYVGKTPGQYREEV